MTRVMAVGVFDLIHVGHLRYLEEAKRLGDELVVVVATDLSVRKRKHATITPQDMRRTLVEALKPVDRAVVGHEDDRYLTVEEIRPDIIALGYDDYHRVDEIKAELARRGLGHIQVVRMPEFDHDLNGTRKIVQRILDREMQKKQEPPADARP
jgi:FAD synthetase